MESIGADLRQMRRTPLAASHVQALRDAGKTVTHPVGAILARSRHTPIADRWKIMKFVVARGGIEPPTRGFSVRCSTN
jgi:hypothetical protein